MSTLAARLAARLADAGPRGVAAVYVFGAHAEGRVHRESDLDVGVLFDRAAHPTRAARFDAVERKH